MRFAALIFSAALAGVSAPAMATGTVACSDGEGAAFSLGVGSVPVAAVVSAEIEADGTYWSLANEDIVLGQDFSEPDRYDVDFMAPDFGDILVRIRLVLATEGDDFAMAGTLQIAGVGAYAVTCEGF